ncbi:hypothetical protein KSP39_PZI019160 [Platanthera zijinensis]|uniref:Uncharacterized protein n=1 Tax=Platanthera zijinensis TaxID=2320716 RepID=A0AAP0B1F0_9ASPA
MLITLLFAEISRYLQVPFSYLQVLFLSYLLLNLLFAEINRYLQVPFRYLQVTFLSYLLLTILNCRDYQLLASSLQVLASYCSYIPPLTFILQSSIEGIHKSSSLCKNNSGTHKIHIFHSL